MTMMRARFFLGGALALVAIAAWHAPVRAGDEAGPNELVHVPTEEMHVLLGSQRKGIVLRYAEYERLLKVAQARAETLEAQPPVDGTLVAASGSLDLTGEKAGRLQLTYDVEVLADGPRSVDFPLKGLAVETLLIQDADGTLGGRYEELNRRPRLRFESPGRRAVTVTASAAYARKGERRFLDLWLPPASAMSLTLRVPAGVEGVVVGEGAAVEMRASGGDPFELTVRPGRSGRLRVAFAPAAKGSDDGPAILDTRSNSLHSVGDGLVHTRAIVSVDVFRTPVRTLTLQVPPEFAVRSLEGKGITGFRRDEARGRLVVDLEKPYLGTVSLVLEGERPYRPEAGLEMPHLTVVGSVRHRAEMSLRFGPDVRVHAIAPEGGRRLPASRAKGQQDLLRYALVRDDARLAVDLEPGAVRLDAVSTYYLNLAEAGKTLIATTTYRVLEGTVFSLRPRMPGGYELRNLALNGKTDGFTRDLRADGTLEIALARGVPMGGEISLAATLEQSRADWVPDGDPVPVPFAVPSSGATREEGLVAIGADAAFQVLEAGLSDLVPVGAAELTARGISAAGLVYGYRLDGAQPSVTLEVLRHEPMLEARIITTLLPSPRRLDVLAVVGHRIRRAGVRRLHVDVPAWAGKEQVRFDSPFVRSASMLEGEARPDDVPAGYERWRVDLNQRVIGRHATVVRYFADQDEENWRLPAERPLGVRVPLERSERFIVVQRAEGLEVRVNTAGEGLHSVELTELPAEAAVDPLRVLNALRLANGAEGVGLEVQKHGGAAVLDAIATQVNLRTAVAREGVLRTRAWVELFNVDRQFLKVSLPPGSELVGAVVDGEAVKVLADPQGVLLVPIPTARSREQTTLASLTYETRLDDEVGGSVRVEAPVFHDLEVLRTVQRVAFDPDLEIQEVEGDFGKVSQPSARERVPWLIAFAGGLASAFSSGADDAGVPGGYAGATSAGDVQTVEAEPVIKDAEIADHVETDNDLSLEGTLGQSEGIADAPFEGPATNAAIGIGGGAGGPYRVRALRRVIAQIEAQERALQAAGDLRRRNRLGEMRRTLTLELERLAGGPGGAEEDREEFEGMRSAEEKPAAPAPMADPADDAGPPPAGGPPPAPRSRPARARDRYHEGDLPPSVQRPGRERRGGRRKGLLSLDVPVVLGPHVVVAQRLGSGGALDIRLRTKNAGVRHYHWLGLVFLALGLLAGAGRRARKFLVLGGGAALAILMALLFGEHASVFVCALADALTLLAILWLLGWALRKLITLTPRVKLPRPPAAEATAAVLVLGLLAIAFAGTARADEPRPPVPNVKPPKRVFVPYDPADPTTVAPTDRVFLPLETYLELYKAAHPESDPELVALGRMVTLVEARYRLKIGRDEGELASGSAAYRFAKRGRGTHLVAWPLGGLAVAEATLDGKPVRLLLDKGVYRIVVTEEGDHQLELRFHVPVVPGSDGRIVTFDVQPFAGATLDIEAAAFDGDVRVSGAGRVEASYDPGIGTKARAWLGHARRVWVNLAETQPADLPAAVRTRAESRTIHSVRDEGTETQVSTTLYVLQGRAPFVDVALPDGVTVLEASGPKVVRWETLATPSPRVRLVFKERATGAVKIALRTVRAAAEPERQELLPALAVLDTTGESGQVVVNADPATRATVVAADNLFRIQLPKDKVARGIDGRGRVVGAWRFAARPTRLEVRTRRVEPRVELDSTQRVVFGDDRVRSTFSGRLTVEARAPVGTLVFDLPGADEVRDVTSPGMDTWWLEGEGDGRRLHVRYRDLRRGTFGVDVRLERRLGGQRDGIAVPRWTLRGARRDRGRLFLYSLPDVEQKLGSVAGLRSLALAGLRVPPTGIEGARVVHAYAWDTPVAESLPVGLRDPDLELEAVVVTLIAPDDEEHGIEHLVLFEVRRGSTDRLQLFVPDGGLDEEAARADVVTTRDLREMRRERVTRTDADGVDVPGTLYDLRLQSARGGVIEVTVSQRWRARAADGPEGSKGADRPVRLVRPEGDIPTHWFSLVRAFLDGQVDVAPLAGKPDVAAWEDLPLVPAGLQRSAVVRSYASRDPYSLAVRAVRHRLESQADAVVQAAVATVVLGMDGWARVRLDYRVFNRARQFLRLRLPEGASLFGATAAYKPVKPLAGAEKTVLLPVPKVPLGGKGYPVSLVYRARAGTDFEEGGALTVLLPEVVGVEVDRTVVRLYAPHGYEYDFDSSMTPTTPEDVAADLAEVAVREARELLKLAETGTLTQRWAATANGTALIAHARQKLQQAPGAAHKHRALVGQLQQLDEQLGKRRVEVQRDLQAARRQSRQSGPAQEEFASNARQLVGLDDVTSGLEDGGRVAMEDKNKAAWVVNPGQSKSKGKGGRADYEQLKQRLATSFRGRAASEKRENFANFGQTRAQGKGKKVPPPQQEATSFDHAQVSWLNAALKKEQVRNRQLGAVDTGLLNRLYAFQTAAGQQQGQPQGQDLTDFVPPQIGQTIEVNGVQLDVSNYGLQGGRSPRAGLFFSDGRDGDFRGRTENIMSVPQLADRPQMGPMLHRSENLDAASVAFRGYYDAEGAPQPQGVGKVGLMGVDVALPKVGRVYYFRSLKAGGPIEIEASRQGISVGGRVVVLLLILLAAALVGTAIRRKQLAAA